MNFEITKYRKPIVWLDTNFVINMARDTDPRTTQVLQFLEKMKGEYFLVQGDNAELRMGNGNTTEYSALLDKLSAGAHFQPYETIEQFQFDSVARASIAGEKKVVLDAQGYLRHDPIRELERSKELGFIIGFSFDIPELRVQEAEWKSSIFQDLVARRPKHRSVRNQQKFEADAPADFFRKLVEGLKEKAKLNPPPTFQELIDEGASTSDADLAARIRFVSDRVQWWRVAAGGRDITTSLQETFAFVQGQAFKMMPFNNISSILWGDIYGGSEELKESDYWDVKHMAALLPFCDIIFTEKRMRMRLEKYKLDAEYGTEVYSMQNIEDFFVKHPLPSN